MPSAEPNRILICRMSAIGDTVHTLPLAAELKKLHPRCFLGWVVEEPSSGLIVGNPLVDWVHVLPRKWLRRPGVVYDLRRRLREQHFDTAFDVQGLAKSSIAAWLSGAPVRIGFTRGEAREIAPVLDNCRVAPTARHAVDITLELLSAIGDEASGLPEFVFPPCPDEDRAKIDAALAKSAGPGGFVLMGPWGSFKSKLWPLERFAELSAGIRAATGLCSLVLGHGPEERALLGGNAAPSCFVPAPDVGLTGVAELARRAALFVGCDSFPMHAAAAVGCPALGLFGVTDPERLGPYGPTGRTVFHRVTLMKSSRGRRRQGQENLLALPVDKVLEVCLDMLDGGFS